jgi:hypothetical protein
MPSSEKTEDLTAADESIANGPIEFELVDKEVQWPDIRARFASYADVKGRSYC